MNGVEAWLKMIKDIPIPRCDANSETTSFIPTAQTLPEKPQLQVINYDFHIWASEPRLRIEK